MLRRMSEKRSDYSCSWCDMYAGSLRGLVAHLVCSHSRLRFQVAVRLCSGLDRTDVVAHAPSWLSEQVGHDNMAHIYVTTTQSNWKSELNANVSPSPCEADLNTDAMDRIEHHYCYFSPKKHPKSAKTPEENKIEERMHEFDELEELSKEQPQEFYAPLLQRQYFHSRTGAVVLDHEKDYDSDDDVDEEWIIKQSEKLLDEFEDVALEEKEFMKKWNRHVKENKCVQRALAPLVYASAARLTDWCCSVRLSWQQDPRRLHGRVVVPLVRETPRQMVRLRLVEHSCFVLFVCLMSDWLCCLHLFALRVSCS